ncbi:efflux RND transporter permease subunit [Microbulbifer halophilus]|uniref:Efflux RND transporter permease subunit n=1 Tax=Microbulbifer halophilus TaxID=453963 RepID=A0ABW5EHC7_9GAMM
MSHSWGSRIPSLEIEVDQAQARTVGISSGDIDRSLKGVITGCPLSDYREGDRIIPIVLRCAGDERASLRRLQSLSVYSGDASAGVVSLSQIARVTLGSGYYKVDRENLVRSITVQGRNRFMTAEDMLLRVKAQLKELEEALPPGHWIEFDGVVVESAEGKAALQANLPLCLGLVFILLVGQFNSFPRLFVILATIPLVIVGVALGLVTMRADVGFMVLLGIYSLAGIIINNAIVLIDRRRPRR